VSWGGGSVFWQPKHADRSELKRAVSWRTERILATKIRCINEWKIIKNCVPQCHNEHKQYLHLKTLSPRSFSTHSVSGLPRDASTFFTLPQATLTSLGCPEMLPRSLLSLRPHRRLWVAQRRFHFLYSPSGCTDRRDIVSGLPRGASTFLYTPWADRPS
jgi:hypothetical protein